MATISGHIVEITGKDFGGAEITIEPRSTPTVDESDLIATEIKKVITESDGSFSVDLVQGDYRVQVNEYDSFFISVPNDDNVYNIVALITTDLTYTYSEVPTTIPKASQISFSPYGDIIATNVQKAIEELADEYQKKLIYVPEYGAYIVPS